jgi:hypothetical protein
VILTCMDIRKKRIDVLATAKTSAQKKSIY